MQLSFRMLIKEGDGQDQRDDDLHTIAIFRKEGPVRKEEAGPIGEITATEGAVWIGESGFLT